MSQQSSRPILLLFIFAFMSLTGFCQDDNERHPDSPLMKAVRTNNIAEVKNLVSSGAEINEDTDNGWYDAPVDVAVQQGYKEIALFLLQKGATSRRYFYSAVVHGDLKFVEQLLTYGYTDSEAVLAAVESRNEQLVDLLLSKGFKVNFAQKRRTGLFRKEYVSPLDAALELRNSHMVVALVKAGAPLDEAFRGACNMADNAMGNMLLDFNTRLDELHSIAVEEGNLGLARTARKKGANPFYENAVGYNILHVAVKSGNKEAMLYAQQECGVQLTSKTRTGADCWMLAASSVNEVLFTELISDPAFTIEATDNLGETVLFYAVRNSNSKVLEVLIGKHPNVNHQDSKGLTAVMIALWNQKANYYALLKTLPIDHTLKSNDGIDLLGYYLQCGNVTTEEVERLIQAGCDPNGKDIKGCNLAYHAVKLGNLSLLQKMKTWNVSLDPKDDRGYRPDNQLSSEITQFILSNGADPDRLNSWGDNYLISAMNSKDISLFAFILRTGADPNTPTRWTKNVLFEVLSDEKIDYLKILLQYKVNLQATDTWGKNALEKAIEANEENVIALLRTAGAKTTSEWAAYEVERNKELAQLNSLVESRNLGAILILLRKYPDIILSIDQQKSLIVTAIQQNNLEMIELLFNQGVSVNQSVNFEQQTVLHLCAKEGNLNLLKLFINKGGDPGIKDAYENTPLDYAKTKEIKTYLKSLLK